MTIVRGPGLGACLAVLLILACAASVSAAEPPGAKAEAPPTAAPQEPLCSAVTPKCAQEGNCSNTPFELTKCWTTTYGPARADVVVVPAGAKPAAATNSPNMLLCQGGRAYALCFFSGPPVGIDGGQALPCILSPDKLTATCTCQYYSSGAYFVDINGILNQGAYYEAINQCGNDGSGCSNITGCSKQDGTCSGSGKPANVCNYINSQSSGNSAGSFYPTAQAQVISTFSFAMSPPNGNYQLATTATTCNGKYAGCMTAPCRFKDGSDPSSHKNGDPIQCECPVYDGPYQVGAAGQSCTIASPNADTYIWSASSTVVQSSDSKK
jgi:hypothetical protein